MRLQHNCTGSVTFTWVTTCFSRQNLCQARKNARNPNLSFRFNLWSMGYSKLAPRKLLVEMLSLKMRIAPHNYSKFLSPEFPGYLK